MKSRKGPAGRARTVTVFGSARCLPGSSDYRRAYETGRLLARAGFTVVNGGYGGIMEASARGAKDAGGRTIAVVARFFRSEANLSIDRKITVGTPNERLMRLVELGDAYIVLKGGTGTLVELLTVWEYANKGIQEDKPIVLIGPAWPALIRALPRHLSGEGLTRAVRLIAFAPGAADAVRILSRRLKKG